MLLTLQLCQARTSAPSRDNSLGAVIEYTNPLMYNMGVIVDGAVVKSNKGRVAVSLRVQPYGTFELYTEQVLLCGEPTDALRHASGPIVLVYKRVAHEMIDGVACHEFENVFHIVPEDK